MNLKKAMDSAIPFILIAAIVGAVGLGGYKGVENMINNALESQPNTPKIMVVDLEGLAKALTERGDSPEQTVLYMDTLMAVLTKQGYLVLEKKATLSVPEGMTMKVVSTEFLMKAAERLGVAPTEADRDKLRESVNDSTKKLESFLN
ncbi:hypothetical protein [Alteromonas gilva]|uniref:Uncharacterized protein n=1 Tax=Alteromonas gilva TaxID=2987522 RepID=A0ABT5L9S3_9ALTE|nr:hypothetical protein [Alteromonas gilva]MDC8832838.1 hypothetical protein [Alteromonas gilva]